MSTCQRRGHVWPSPVRIVFTGGPNGGKTTVIARVKKKYEDDGWTVIHVRESATRLIQTVGMTTVKARRATVAGCRQFQNEIFRLQVAGEQWAEQLAHDSALEGRRNILMLFDRSCFDGEAFMEGTSMTWDDFLKQATPVGGAYAGNFRADRTFAGFDGVVHMMSRASGPDGQDCYCEKSDETGTERLHNAKQAIATDETLLRVYGLHPRRKVIEATRHFQDKLARVLEFVDVVAKP